MDLVESSRDLVGIDGAARALMAREQHDIQSAITVAKSYPRDEERCRKKVMDACGRPSFAEAALYRFKRGGSQVIGPSVQFAREAARIWGNIRYGVNVLPSGRDDEFYIESWAADLETNTRVTSEARFKKKIQRKQGGKAAWIDTDDERELRELINRHGAFGVRNCILQLLPADLVDEAEGRCRETARGGGGGSGPRVSPDLAKKTAAAFSALGVEQAQLEARLGHPLSAMTGAERAELLAIYNSIRDGQSLPEEHFAAGETRAVDELNRKIRGDDAEVDDPFAED